MHTSYCILLYFGQLSRLLTVWLFARMCSLLGALLWSYEDNCWAWGAGETLLVLEKDLQDFTDTFQLLTIASLPVSSLLMYIHPKNRLLGLYCKDFTDTFQQLWISSFTRQQNRSPCTFRYSWLSLVNTANFRLLDHKIVYHPRFDIPDFLYLVNTAKFTF